VSKELADRVVALGVGKANQIYPDALGRFYQIDPDADWQTSVNAESFVNDGRVVLALMEKCQAIFIERLNDTKWACRADKAYGERTREWFDRGSLAPAIIEACCDALEQAVEIGEFDLGVNTIGMD